MLRHPNVVAAFVLSGGMLLSSILICIFIHSLDATLKSKPMVGYASQISIPKNLGLHGDLDVTLQGRPNHDTPILIQQRP